MTPAIKSDFPFESLHLLAERESWRKEVVRPVYHVHKWWANRLGSVFRAILLSALSDDEEVWKRFYQRNHFHKTVLDPFMGSGTTIGEAVKLGCKAIGCDINPVSYFLVKKAFEAVDVEALELSFSRIENAIKDKILYFYKSTDPGSGKPAKVLYAFWVKIAMCPVCGKNTRLFKKWIFASHAYPDEHPVSHCICPKCGEIIVVQYKDASATCPNCSFIFNPQIGPARKTTAVCENCEREFAILEAIRKTESPPDHQMYALMLLLEDGHKIYKRPDQGDISLCREASKRLREMEGTYPRDPIPSGINTDQARAYNYRFWHQMFNDRQLYCLSTLLEQILHEEDRNIRENLLLLFSGTLEFNNMFCSFKGEGTGAVRHLFSHHILKPERMPLENNPWGTEKSSGSFSTLFRRRLLSAKAYCQDPFEIELDQRTGRVRKIFGINKPISSKLGSSFQDLSAGRADILLLQGDSSKLPLPNASVDLVITDPPYFDNVNYSELADFFYVWLKLGLAKDYSCFQWQTTRSEQEVQGNDSLRFRKTLGNVFEECLRVLKPRGFLTFTFHHARDEAWIALAGALHDAGLEVLSTYPIKAEMSVAAPKTQTSEPINLDAIFFCHRLTSRRRVDLAELTEHTATETKRILERFDKAGIRLTKGDVRVVFMSQMLKMRSKAAEETTALEKLASQHKVFRSLVSESIDKILREYCPREPVAITT